MIYTGCLDSSYREVEGADTGEDSYEAAHVWSDSIGKIVNGD
jgi:hypothetical protein